MYIYTYMYVYIYIYICIYIISLCHRKGFSLPFNLVLCCVQPSFTANYKTDRKNRFFNGAASN